MRWKSLRSEALSVVLMLGVLTVLPVLFGDPPPTWQNYAFLTVGLIAVRVSAHVVPALWHRWRASGGREPDGLIGRYGR